MPRAIARVLSVACLASAVVGVSAAPALADSDTAGMKVPAIASISAPYAAPGAELTIIGTDFKKRTDGGYVTMCGVRIPDDGYVFWSETRIVVRVPAGIGPGEVVITQRSKESNGVAFRLAAQPRVTSLSKDYALVGDTVAILGSGFGSTPGKVTIGGRLIDAASWSDTQVTFVVPGFAQAYVGVVADGVVSNGVWSTHAPRVDSVSAAWAKVGDAVVVRGAGFGDGTDGWVSLGGKRLPVVAWTDSAITVSIPEGAATGYLGVVRGYWATSNGKWLGICSVPSVTSLSATSGRPGDRLTIYGRGFGAVPGSGFASVCGVRAEVLSWSDTAVTVIVPEGISAGYAGIYQCGVSSNGIFFMPAQP